MTAGGEAEPPSGARDFRPFRILVVTTSYPRFADDCAGHFVESLASEVAAQGAEVTVLAPHEAGLADYEERGGVSIHRFRYAPERFERVAYGDGIPSNIRRYPSALLGLPSFAFRLRSEVAARARFMDVVHLQWAPTAALAGPGLLETPAVLTLHGSDTTLAKKGGIWRRLLTDGLKRARRVIAVSKEQVEFLRAEGLFSGPIDVLPCGVPASLLDRERAPRPSDGPFTFAYAGRLVASKGVLELVDAFARIAERVPDARLVVAGGGPEEEALRGRVQSAGLTGRVEMLGALPHEEALDIVARADALVLASHGEGSPLSVTEALALGTPVVGTRVGAMPELLGENGLIVEPGDVSALADAMVRIAQDHGLAERLSREGRERVREHYTWPKVAEAVSAVYREALGDA